MRVCIYVCVCNQSTIRNFYPIGTKLGTLVGLVKIQVMFEDGLYVTLGGTTKKNKF